MERSVLKPRLVVSDQRNCSNQHGNRECGWTWVDRRISWLGHIILFVSKYTQLVGPNGPVIRRAYALWWTYGTGTTTGTVPRYQVELASWVPYKPTVGHVLSRLTSHSRYLVAYTPSVASIHLVWSCRPKIIMPRQIKFNKDGAM